MFLIASIIHVIMQKNYYNKFESTGFPKDIEENHTNNIPYKQDPKDEQIKAFTRIGTCLSNMPHRNKIIYNINSKWQYLTCSHFLGL